MQLPSAVYPTRSSGCATSLVAGTRQADSMVDLGPTERLCMQAWSQSWSRFHSKLQRFSTSLEAQLHQKTPLGQITLLIRKTRIGLVLTTEAFVQAIYIVSSMTP
jgi:hypothetical protein